MADNTKPQSSNSSDEIDLGQLFKLVEKGFNAIFQNVLRIFLYLKKSALILLGLIIVGFIVGFGLNQIISEKLKIEVIVNPQMESKNYLYDAVDEIQASIISKDTLFFKSIGIDKVDFNGLEVEIKRVIEETSTESDLLYLELLQSFENTDAIADIVRAELQNKSSYNHRITFYFRNAELGKIFANKVMDYINTNSYFDGIIEVYRSNANSRIQENQILLKQVDEIILNYTNSLTENKESPISERIVLDNQEQVNIADLFEFKNRLIRDIEGKKIELEKRTDPVSILNFGKPQIVQKSFFVQSIVLIPFLLLAAFFIISILGYLNRKSQSL